MSELRSYGIFYFGYDNVNAAIKFAFVGIVEAVELARITWQDTIDHLQQTSDEVGLEKWKKLKEQPMTTKDLIFHLTISGYRYFKPKCTIWKYAFICKHGDSILCVLFRKNGIDLRYYERYTGGLSVDKQNRLSMIGGEIFRNHFNESSALITKKIKEISGCFTRGRCIDSMRIEDGRSYLLNENYQSIRSKSKESFNKKREALIEASNNRTISEYMVGFGEYWGMN
jgi:hypothetical protein